MKFSGDEEKSDDASNGCDEKIPDGPSSSWLPGAGDIGGCAVHKSLQVPLDRRAWKRRLCESPPHATLQDQRI